MCSSLELVGSFWRMGRRCSRAEKEKRKIWARRNVWTEWCETCTKDICLVYQIVEVCEEERCFIFQGIFYSIQLGRYINKVVDVRDSREGHFQLWVIFKYQNCHVENVENVGNNIYIDLQLDISGCTNLLKAPALKT